MFLSLFLRMLILFLMLKGIFTRLHFSSLLIRLLVSQILSLSAKNFWCMHCTYSYLWLLLNLTLGDDIWMLLCCVSDYKRTGLLLLNNLLGRNWLVCHFLYFCRISR